MSGTEHSTKTPRAITGPFAVLGALLGVQGGGARRGALSVAVAVAVVVGTLLLAPIALAAGPPLWNEAELNKAVFSTRASIGGTTWLDDGELETEWRAFYSSVSSSGPWNEVNKGTASGATAKNGGTAEAWIGAQDPESFQGPGAPYWLRGLVPNTSYWARFTAKNADGEAEKVVPFKTLPVAKPEIDGFVKGGSAEATDTSAGFEALIEDNGAAESKYAFEYAPAETGDKCPVQGAASWGAFTSGATGTVTAAEEYAVIEAQVTGLSPETRYCVRIKMSNSQGEAVQTKYASNTAPGAIHGEVEFFTTPTAKVLTNAELNEVRNVTIDSALVPGSIQPHGSETHWRFEYATSVIGPWTVVAGAEAAGTISQAQAEAVPYGHSFRFLAHLSGLSPSTKYYVRLFAENAAGEGEIFVGLAEEGGEGYEPISASTEVGLGIFETSGSPSARTFAVHALQGESLELLGGVNSRSTPTSAEQAITVEGAPTGGAFTLTFDGRTTKPLAYDAPASEVEPGSVAEALRHELGLDTVVEGPAGGPYTVFFVEPRGVGEPQIEANGAELTPAGQVTVHTDFKGGETTEVHYRFQYVSEAAFAEDGWSGARETSEAVAPSGAELQVVKGLLPALTAGETYRYRTLVTSSAGGGVVEGAEQTLTVPAPPAAGASSCPNGAFRTGLSAQLPDCRAYEMVSPVEKKGSQEPFGYSGGVSAGVVVGEDGEHVALDAESVSWGPGAPAQAGGSPYFFSREAGQGWRMTVGAPQPETGAAAIVPNMYAGDLHEFAFESKPLSASSSGEVVDYKAGPPGGPYASVASVPRATAAASEEDGWVAGNASWSKLVLATADYALGGEATGTRSGWDLYEYTASSGLRQLNVAGEPAATIGTCGARVAHGYERGAEGLGDSGPHSVSADGSRVFFYAGFAHECPTAGEFKAAATPDSVQGQGSGPRPRLHLYVRVNGAETRDLGPYEFLGANREGTRLLVENGAHEVLSYDVETGATQAQSSAERATEQELALLGIPYTHPGEITPETEIEAGEGSQAFSHPRYSYWHTGHGRNQHGGPFGSEEDGQVYRYDSVEHVEECISCASSFDPEPKQPAYLSSDQVEAVNGGSELDVNSTSANGDFAFFTTPAALVKEDEDGEIPFQAGSGDCTIEKCEYADAKGGVTSPSSDIYEWRKLGVDGCAQLQGCLALITDGRGGYMNLLLGTADEGRDVFIYTKSQLLGQDKDSAGDIYDARIDGGLPEPPPRPTECEGDACSTAPPAPNDATPSSLTFTGEGNITQPSAKPVMKSTKPKTKRKTKKKKMKRSKKGKKRKAGKSANRSSSNNRKAKS